MITEDYCSFEVAKLLKEKGFTEDCYGRYFVKIKEFFLDTTKPCNNGGNFLYSAPTHQMAMKWLRKKGVIIVIQPEYFNAESKCSAWGVDIWADDNYEKLQGDFPSYEEAVEEALKYSLEKLI